MTCNYSIENDLYLLYFVKIKTSGWNNRSRTDGQVLLVLADSL